MSMWSHIRADYRAVFKGDPAARSALEVVLSYSGLHAMFMHRVAHAMLRAGVPYVPRLLSQFNRFITGIEIHPAARIGPGLFIDHGMGVVIGETSEIGRDCLLYQGVTLGGTGKDTGKRHPTLGDGVVIGAGAKILGAIRIGNYVKIGANSVVLRPVPDYSIVVGVPGRVIKKKVMRMHEEGLVEVLDHAHMPDPVEERFHELEAQLHDLRTKLERLEGKKIAMKIYNTMTGRKEDFEPIVPGKVGMYVCGVTVYDVCHIGHARSAVVFDVMRKYLRHKGFSVNFIKNFTDIDDKIINRANERGIAWDELARIYTDKYYEDMDRLGIERADVEPKATEHIEEIKHIVQALEQKGNAYALDGDVYFEVASFPQYGKLSGRKLEDMQAGARVAVDERKRSPMDFALWKSSKPGEPAWASPWGPGRPGWHIECTAMSMKYLGESFDIHGGGADLSFPHHENELTQSEAYSGKPFVKYWVHNGFITVDKEKMSKSLGNFFTIEDILAKFDAEVVRLFLVQTHYRSPIEFSDQLLKETETSLDRYYSTALRVADFMTQAGAKDKPAGADELAKGIERCRAGVEAAMDDDFNTAQCLGHLFELIHEVNKFLDMKPSGEKTRAVLGEAMTALKELGGVLGLFTRTPREWHLSLLAVKGIGLGEADIEARIQKRLEARANKEWAHSDAIRDDLAAKGVVLEDKPGGVTTWKVKAG